MPLYKSIAVDNETHVLIWQITESETDLASQVQLGEVSTKRLSGMKSEMHRRAYLSVRHLLAIAQYNDVDLTYSEEGKPSLVDGVHISITHSYEFAAIILSAHPVGIDIEKQRDKIQRIAEKFATKKEAEHISKSDDIVKSLTIIWGAKESLYKLFGTSGLSFQQHIEIAPFSIDSPYTVGSIHYKNQIEFYHIHIIDFEGFNCVYALTKHAEE